LGGPCPGVVGHHIRFAARFGDHENPLMVCRKGLGLGGAVCNPMSGPRKRASKTVEGDGRRPSNAGSELVAGALLKKR